MISRYGDTGKEWTTR